MLPVDESRIDVDPDVLEQYLLSFPQAECPVVHHFGPGIYIREVTIPKGALALGHAQRHKHLNIVLKGSVAVIDDGRVKVVSAPAIFVGEPGRKMGGCIEECVWQNVYPNTDECRDIEELERRWFVKSPVALMYEKCLTDVRLKHSQPDRDDYRKFLKEIGFTDEQVRSESEFTGDMVDLPVEYAARVSVRQSGIEGNGLFLCSPVCAGDIIAPARLSGKRTVAGRYVNHSKAPNSEYRRADNGDVYLYAIRDLHGSLGGSAGSELTANYRDAARVSGRIGVSK